MRSVRRCFNCGEAEYNRIGCRQLRSAPAVTALLTFNALGAEDERIYVEYPPKSNDSYMDMVALAESQPLCSAN